MLFGKHQFTGHLLVPAGPAAEPAKRWGSMGSARYPLPLFRKAGRLDPFFDTAVFLKVNKRPAIF